MRALSPNSLWSALLFGGLIQLVATAAAYAQDTATVPSNLQVTGTITTKTGVTIKVNDNVLVVRESGGQTEGSGTVLTADGTYFVDMSKTTAFNGTKLSMRLVTGGKTFQLVTDSTPVSFSYSGGFPFPVRLNVSPTVGDLITVTPDNPGGGDSGGGTTPGGTPIINAQFDVNGDGVFDDRDIKIIRDAVTGKVPDPKADVNGDGIINTRDLIDAIKALNDGRQHRFRVEVQSTTGTNTNTSTSSSTSTTTNATTTTK